MIKGIGTDLANMERIKGVLERQGARFSNRVLAPAERERFQSHHKPECYLAKRWAVKEAAAKALGCGIGAGAKLHDITLSHTPSGAPILNFAGDALASAEALGAQQWHVSLSDEDHYVLAFVVLT